ncbi:hypothetical protein NST36_19075 [Bacillus sp. FSL R5-0293]|uniref:hypothetical protein n=1 Tax=Bacillus sp. FSL R5-0293 TaxID=2954584 RepID=UPI0030F4C2C2
MSFSNYDYLLQMQKDVKRRSLLNAIQFFALFFALFPVLPVLKNLLGSSSLGNLLFLFLISGVLFLALATLLMYMDNIRFSMDIKLVVDYCEKLLDIEKDGIPKDLLDKCLGLILEKYDEKISFQEKYDINNLNRMKTLKEKIQEEIEAYHKQLPGVETRYSSVLRALHVVETHLFKAFDTKFFIHSKRGYFYRWYLERLIAIADQKEKDGGQNE